LQYRLYALLFLKALCCWNLMDYLDFYHFNMNFCLFNNKINCSKLQWSALNECSTVGYWQGWQAAHTVPPTKSKALTIYSAHYNIFSWHSLLRNIIKVLFFSSPLSTWNQQKTQKYICVSYLFLISETYVYLHTLYLNVSTYTTCYYHWWPWNDSSSSSISVLLTTCCFPE
jgi:hypothetical protein